MFAMARLSAWLVACLVGCGSSSSNTVTDDTGSGDDTATDDTGTGDDTGTPGDGGPTDSGVKDTGPSDTPVTTDRSKCAADPDKLGLTNRQATYKGTTIKYLGFAPPGYDPKAPLSVVLALHGAGDTMSNYFNAVWKGAATTKKFFVITPEGSSPAGAGFTWNSGDANAILATLDDFEACYSVDSHRRIIDGFSAGGIMAYMIGLAAAESFAGVSIAAANLGSGEALYGKKLLPAPWKIPVSHFHGVDDKNFPIDTARSGRDRLTAAGHKVYWHEFPGGHTTSAADAAKRYDDLATSTAP